MKTLTFCLALIASSCTLAFGQSYKVLYSFGSHSDDGANPIAGLVSDGAGNLYGTTKIGGTPNFPTCPGSGCGAVFELTPNADGSWGESVLYAFCASGACLDGAFPESALVIDSLGNLYGTTQGGGDSQFAGTVFELSPPSAPGGAWTETVLYNFCSLGDRSCTDGYAPIAALTFDSSGNLYGTTQFGGSGASGSGAGSNGVVFELTPGSGGWTENVLYNFCPKGNGKFCPDGSQPAAGVTFDKVGNLYGTTMAGGAPNSGGGGTIYKLTPGSGGWTESVVAASRLVFVTGAAPMGEASIDSHHNLYSTISRYGPDGGGAVFKLAPGGRASGTFFDGQPGCMPTSGVTLDAQNDALYGTLSFCGINDGGAVYKMSSLGQVTTLYSFCPQSGCADGSNPVGGLIEDAAGNLYGTTKNGGASGNGVVFEITP